MLEDKIKPTKHFELYIFGSSVYSNNPNDLDLAIIYDKNFINIKQALEFRIKLINTISDLDLDIDTILLSKEEELQIEFLKNAKHKKLHTT